MLNKIEHVLSINVGVGLALAILCVWVVVGLAMSKSGWIGKCLAVVAGYCVTCHLVG